MRRVVVWYLLFHACCGVYTWGTLSADWDYKRHNQYAILHMSARENLGEKVFFAAIGPPDAIISAVATNFNRYGWEWREQE